MATITKYETAAGVRWRVQYRTPDRRNTCKRGFKRKLDAQRFAEEVEVAKRSGQYIEPAKGTITVSEAAVDWLAVKEAKLKPSSWNSIETAWRVHVQPEWGQWRLVDITELSIEKWLARQKGSPTVVIRMHGVLAGILDNAVREHRLPHNPARGITNLPRKTRKHRTYLTHSQVDQLAAASGDKGTIVLLLAYTGLRWGELVALRGKDVDRVRRRIQVRRNVVQVNNELHEGTPKTGEQRTVPVPVFIELPEVGDDELLFHRADGSFLRRPVSRTGWFQMAVKRSGVPEVSVHDLRHTAASLAVSAGAHVKVVQRMLGHASAAMTLDTYADLFDSDLDDVAAAMAKQRDAVGM